LDAAISGIAGRDGPALVVCEQLPARRRSRGRSRADRPGRFLHDDVDVGISCPADIHDEVAHERAIDRASKRVRLILGAGCLQPIDRGL